MTLEYGSVFNVASWNLNSVRNRGRIMSDLYDKTAEDVPFRRMRAEKSGFVFELPLVVPNVPRIAEKLK